jgi:hypothetical protein
MERDGLVVGDDGGDGVEEERRGGEESEGAGRDFKAGRGASESPADKESSPPT